MLVRTLLASSLFFACAEALAADFGCTKIITTTSGELRAGCGHAVAAASAQAAGEICKAAKAVKVDGTDGKDCCKHPAGTVKKIEVTPIGKPNEKTLVDC